MDTFDAPIQTEYLTQAAATLRRLGVDETTLAVACGLVHEHVAPAVFAEGEEDVFIVDVDGLAAQCNVAGHYCTACDPHPAAHLKRQPQGGLLCAHRIAAMFVARHLQLHKPDAQTILSRLLLARRGPLTVVINRQYIDFDHGHVAHLYGYKDGDAPHVCFRPPLELDAMWFRQTLYETGWVHYLHRVRARDGSGQETYFVRPGAAAELQQVDGQLAARRHDIAVPLEAVFG